MLLAEELHVSQDQEQQDSSTILVAPHQSTSVLNPNIGLSSSTSLLPTPQSFPPPQSLPHSQFAQSVAPPYPPPFQFPYPSSPSQNYFPSLQGNYSGSRFQRNNNNNNNRFKGPQFPKPYLPSFQGNSGWNSGFQSNYGGQGTSAFSSVVGYGVQLMLIAKSVVEIITRLLHVTIIRT